MILRYKKLEFRCVYILETTFTLHVLSYYIIPSNVAYYVVNVLRLTAVPYTASI